MTAAEEKRLRKQLRELTAVVGRFICALDAEMIKPSTPERGKRIAALLNALNMANDRARYFGLGIDYRKDSAKRKAREFGTSGWLGS